MMSKRVNAYAELRAEEKDKAVGPTPNLEDTRVGLNALKLLKCASYLMRFGQQILTWIISGLEEVLRLAFLELKHKLKRALRPQMSPTRQQSSRPTAVYLT